MMVVWQQQDGTNLNTYYTWSTTGAAGLINNAALLNNSTPGAQQNPHLSYANGTFHVVFTDAASGNVIYKSATIMPTVVICVEGPAPINVYPSPSHGDITLDLAGFGGDACTIRVSEMSGRLVSESTSVSAPLFIIARKEAGVYQVEVTDEVTGKRWVERIIFY